MEAVDSMLEPEYEEGSQGFTYCTPVADNEDEGYMTFVQALLL